MSRSLNNDGRWRPDGFGGWAPKVVGKAVDAAVSPVTSPGERTSQWTGRSKAKYTAVSTVAVVCVILSLLAAYYIVVKKPVSYVLDNIMLGKPAAYWTLGISAFVGAIAIYSMSRTRRIDRS